MEKQRHYHIKKGDLVKVLRGKEKGKTGRVLRMIYKKERAIVEKVNFIKRHVRPGHPMAPQGGIIEREGPIHISNLMVVCPKCHKPSRTRNHRLSSGASVRVCVKCGEQFS